MRRAQCAGFFGARLSFPGRTDTTGRTDTIFGDLSNLPNWKSRECYQRKNRWAPISNTPPTRFSLVKSPREAALDPIPDLRKDTMRRTDTASGSTRKVHKSTQKVHKKYTKSTQQYTKLPGMPLGSEDGHHGVGRTHWGWPTRPRPENPGKIFQEFSRVFRRKNFRLKSDQWRDDFPEILDQDFLEGDIFCR